MYKLLQQKLRSRPVAIAKLLLIMRLTTILLITGFLQVSAAGFAQKISLSEKDVSLTRVLNRIKAQTGYDFFYESINIRDLKNISIQVKNEELTKVLARVLTPQNLEFEIDDKSIIIKVREKAFFERMIARFQAIDVRGKVVDDRDFALAGATVLVKGTKRVTRTDDQGKFFIPDVANDAVLIISYIGYTPLEISLKGATIPLEIKLNTATGKLEEVAVTVNTGYQKIKKDQLTGAASTLTEEQYQQREAITGNFLESLEGKVPGLVYNGQTGELSIRGVSTFDAVKQPLIVLDGFPTEIDLRTINPNDIISVSVLRDAAAASIYGVRASNGVIIIETRRGKSGKATLNFNSSYAVQAKPDFSYLKYIGAAEFVQLQKAEFQITRPGSFLYDFGIFKKNPAQEILFRGPMTGVTNPALSQAQVDAQLLELGAYDNLKDYENLFYQQRQTKNLNLDVSGGNDASTYFVGFNYIGDRPVARRSENNQFSLNLANTIRFSRHINLDLRGTYTHITNRNGNTPAYGDFFPYERLTDQDGNALPVSLGQGRNYSTTFIDPTFNTNLMAAGLYDMRYFPYLELAGNTTTAKSNSVRFQGRLNAKITNWLNVDLGGNFEHQQMLTDRLQTDDVFTVRRLVNSMALRNATTGKAMFSNMPAGDILRKNSEKLINYTLRGQLNFNKSFDNEQHNFSGILGAEQKKTSNEGYLTSFFGYNGQSLIFNPINMNALNSTTSPAFAFDALRFLSGARFSSTNYFSESFGDRRFMSYYGQGTYIFKSKYVATGSFRIDQSNLFGVDPQYRNKPLWSAGLNWRLGEEGFIKKLDWVNQLQLRAATGFNGNVPTSNNGAFLILNTALNTTFTTPLSYNEVLTPENQSLRWETTQNYNFGLDYALFNNRISGSVDYYLKRSKDVFGQFDADPTSGFNQYNANTASIDNRGLEFLVNSSNIRRKGFAWNTMLTASFNHNKVTAVKATEFNTSVQYVNAANPVKGQPLGSLYSYNYGGLNSTGQPYVLDRNGTQRVLAFATFGTGVVDVSKDDLLYSGTTTPKYVLGLNNQFSVGNFDLSVLFMYYGGHVMRVEQPMPNNLSNSTFPVQGSSEFWRKTGDETQTRVPGFVLSNSAMPGYFPSDALNGYRYAGEYVRKADYIRLRDLIVTYNARAKFLQNAGLRNTQLRFQAQNPFRYTFSGNDIDPDAIDRLSGLRRLETQPLYSLTLSTNF